LGAQLQPLAQRHAGAQSQVAPQVQGEVSFARQPQADFAHRQSFSFTLLMMCLLVWTRPIARFDWKTQPPALHYSSAFTLDEPHAGTGHRRE
jgi:hypothetical protein